MKGTGEIGVVFENGGDLRRWLRARAPLPAGIHLTTFQDANGPKLENTGFVAYVEEPTGSLYGKNYWAYFELCERRRPRLTFYDASYAWLVENASAIICYFAERGAQFAYACASQEKAHRHLFRYDLWGTGRMATTTVGIDTDRYVPGLYWMNYYSSDYAQQHDLDVVHFSADMDGMHQAVRDKGNLLTLYALPARWSEYAARIDTIIELHPQFFSLSRIPPPKSIGPKEIIMYFRHLEEQWP